ncbi:MAG: M1 family aminopeptidase, partial [candidate division KSB1 bacterium]|nr:M1 family aminopeptidase [candidate division KSB1 bacterium]
ARLDHGLPDFQKRAEYLLHSKSMAHWPQLTNQELEDLNRYDVLHYTLNLVIEPESKTPIRGVVTTKAVTSADTLSSVLLHLSSQTLFVDSVQVDGKTTTCSHQGDQLRVFLPATKTCGDTFQVAVAYHGWSNYTGAYYGGGMNISTYKGHTIVATKSEPFFARNWWPCKDVPWDKATSTMIVTVGGKMTVASNGLLKEVQDNPDGTKTFRWEERYPITTYLISFAASDYFIFSDTYQTLDHQAMPIQYYVVPEDSAAAREDFSVTRDMITYFAGTFVEYPFVEEKYGMVEVPSYGMTMEHQTMTSYDGYLITGDHRNDWINLHELAHQWWGNLITTADWHHIWLNEGFASYAEALYYENRIGQDYYRAYMQGFDYQGYFRGSVYVYDDSQEENIFTLTVYWKGAWVLHMLRHVVGDSTFFQLMRNYLSDPRYAYGNATTENFQSVCEATSGQDLSWFFQQWVYGMVDRPHYQYSWSAVDLDSGTVVDLRIQQTQDASLIFKMPIDITLTTNLGDTTITVLDSLVDQRFRLFLPHPYSGVTEVQLDKDNWILKKVTLTSVAEHQPGPPLRYELFQNYPNPFNSSTVIRYDLPQPSFVTLEIYNLLGQKVRTLVKQVQPPGPHQITWDGQSDKGQWLTSGLYFCRLQVGEFARVRKLVLQK